jgi:FG-GAP repeat
VEPSGGWANMTQTAKLTAAGPTYSQELGASIAIQNNYVVAGAPRFSHTTNGQYSPFYGEGASYIFVEPAGGWTNESQSAMLTGSDARLGSDFGTAVAISGNTIVSTRSSDNLNLGAGYVFAPYTPQ